VTDTQPTIKDQIDLEKRMVAYGISRYKHSVASAEENGRAADTDHAQKLMQTFLDPVSAALIAYCADGTATRSGKYRVLLRMIDPDKAAYFGIRAVLNHFTKDEPLASLGIKIGTMIEDELKFTKFRETHGNYYDTIIRDFKNKGTKSYRHMHRVLTLKANEHGVEWQSWSAADKCSVGIKIVDLILENTDMIEKTTGEHKGGKHKAAPVIIRPTASCLDWIKRFSHYAELLNPDRVPCIIPPDPWTALQQGGYYSPQLRQRTPLVKSKSKKHTEMLLQADLSQVQDAVNTLQETEWEINTDVYGYLRQAWDQSLPLGLPSSEPYIIPECPINKPKKAFTAADKETFEQWKAEARLVHTMERERVSKCFQVIRVLRLAHEYKEKSFWFVWQCDFRGRMYCTVSGLSPQGADFGKALLRFKNGKALGKAGVLWFKIHGANCFGKDKLPYMERVKWIDDNSDMLKSIADEPLSNSNLWAGADKPWQFLAWVLEYRQYLIEGETFVSKLPVGLDGSCNGIQNFSALLRDEIGGRATNLLPTDRPFDIYSEVARVCTQKLKLYPDNPQLQKWLALAESDGGQLSRNLTKRPVMTLPYGSTRQSCREYIFKYLLEYKPDFFNKKERFMLSVALTPILWQSIAEVVIAARSAMDWIQKCAGILAKAGHGVTWVTPSGFLVYQERKKTKSRQVHTELAGHFRLRLDEDLPSIDGNKQRLGAAPNFIHSMDASHLTLTLKRAKEAGLTALACIHDDYGTYAADTPKLHQCIREGFLEQYSQFDPIQRFIDANQHEGIILPPKPIVGNLDINQILKAGYFFG